MKFKLLLFLFIITVCKSFAQENEIHTEVYLDNPSKLSKHSLMISPVSVRTTLPLIMDFGFEVKGYTEIARKLALEGFVAIPYASENETFSNKFSSFDFPNLPEINDNLNSSFDLEIGAILTLDETIGMKNYEFNIEQYYTSDGNTIYKKIHQNANIRKRMKFRLGYKRHSGFSFLLKPSSDNYFSTTRGDKFYNNFAMLVDVPPSYPTSNYNPEHGISVSKTWATNSSTNMVYFGLEFDRSFNIIIHNDKLGLKKFRYTTRFYIDLIIGSTKFDDFKFYKTNPHAQEASQRLLPVLVNYTPVVGHGFEKNNFGLRVGYEFYQSAPTVFGKYFDKNILTTGLQYGAKAEAGVLPGINSDFYAAITLYLAFNK